MQIPPEKLQELKEFHANVDALAQKFYDLAMKEQASPKETLAICNSKKKISRSSKTLF